MDHRALLGDAARRPLDTARVVLADLGVEQLNAMPGGVGNSIAWLVWHAARQLDVQLSTLSGGAMVWTTGDWAARLGVARGADDFGFGDGRAEVAALQVADPMLLGELLAECVEALVAYVEGLSEADLDEVVDRAWTPPVTRGVRLVSIIDDAVAHLGQAAYARGLLDDWSIGY